MSEEQIEVPAFVDEVIAWRAWQVIGSVKLPILSSVSHTEMTWHPGRWTHATCSGDAVCRRVSREAAVITPGLDRIPGEECSCGLYAAKDRAQLVKLGYNAEGPKPVFIGEVGLVGKVIPGTQGWRAEKGRIVKLYVPFHHWRYVDALAELYDVPVQLDNTTKDVPTFGAEGSQHGNR